MVLLRELWDFDRVQRLFSLDIVCYADVHVVIADSVTVGGTHLDISSITSAKLFFEYVSLSTGLLRVQGDRWFVFKLGNERLSDIIVND